MPLSGALANIVLGRPCPYCGHVVHKKGSWFQSISHYKCASCKKQWAVDHGNHIVLDFVDPEGTAVHPGFLQLIANNLPRSIAGAAFFPPTRPCASCR